MTWISSLVDDRALVGDLHDEHDVVLDRVRGVVARGDVAVVPDAPADLHRLRRRC